MVSRIGILTFVLSLGALAQTYTGSIGGTITDSTGAAVPAAQVTIRSPKNNSTLRTTATEAGSFLVPFLQPGTYEVTVGAKGFKEFVETGVTVQISQPVRLEIKLTVGDVSERVEVTSSAAELNTTSSEIGYSVSEQVLLNIPLVNSGSRGRSPLLLSKILPGVSSTSVNNSNINNFSFGGGRPVSNEILVDGLPTTNVSDQTYTFTPSPESLQEMKVLTVPFSAEYGHTGGGVLALSSKAGGNDYHFMVFDFFRNRLLNARAPFQGDLTQKYVQNTPGGNIGGPVRLPGYNGKNKTFFFSDFNVTLSNTGGFFQALVPTAAERGGDFSQTSLGGGRFATLYDPATTRTENGRVVRDLFPGGRIPTNRIDPVAGKILGFFPSPNTLIGGNNYAGAPPTVRQTWQWLNRVDHTFSEKDRGFVRVGGYNPNTEAVAQIPNKANNQTAGGFTDLQIVLNETHVFSPRLVNDFRAGLSQEVNYSYPPASASPELGLQGVPLNEFPIINISGFLRLGSNAYQWDRNRSYVFSEALVWQLGKHNIKTGGDYRWQMYNQYYPGKLSGTYTFSPSFTTLPGTANSGYALADFLLGLGSASFSTNDYTFRQTVHNAAMYFQDDWKVNRRLTVNLGVRWQFNGPYTEKNNQFGSFSPTAINRTTGTPGEVLFAGRDGAPRNFTPYLYNSFLPRIGFAYKLQEKTVIRAGFGMFRLPSIGFASVGQISQYGVAQTFASTDGGVTPGFSFATGVPARSFNVDAQGRPRIPASLTSPSTSVTMLDGRSRFPYNANWQIGIQRLLPFNWLLDLNYAANKGTKLPIALGINQLRPDQFSIPARQALRPFPQYTGVTFLANDGNSSYNSLQVSLERRYRNGFQMLFAYTWSKVITDVDGPARTNGVGVQDVYNLRNERGIAGYDVPHRVVLSYVYNLPFGKHGKYLKTMKAVNWAVDGWQLSGITEFQSGLPLTINNPSNQLGGFTATQRPIQTAPAAYDRGDRTLDKWFNTGAFTAANALQFGTAPRFPLYRPGINNWDTSLMRNFQLGDRFRLQFRGAFYNTLNHGQYNAPGNTLNTTTFGKISSGRDARITELALRIFF